MCGANAANLYRERSGTRTHNNRAVLCGTHSTLDLSLSPFPTKLSLFVKNMIYSPPSLTVVLSLSLSRAKCWMEQKRERYREREGKRDRKGGREKERVREGEIELLLTQLFLLQ